MKPFLEATMEILRITAKRVINTDGYYVTSDGKIFSLRKNMLHELRPCFSKGKRGEDKYLRVTIKYKKETKIKMLHRIVAEAWIPNPEKKPYINHKDGVK